MPAFTFEKLSPPAGHSPIPAAARKRRSVIFQILDRFAEARVNRTLPDDNGAIAGHEPELPD